MAANKHHPGDVVRGAAIGMAAGRTVTVSTGKVRFEIGVAPARGGATVTVRTR